MMISFADTVVDTVNDTSRPYTSERPYSGVIVYADRNVHLALDRAATTTDFLLAANTYFIVGLLDTQTLNYILAAAEADGTIRLTRTLATS